MKYAIYTKYGEIIQICNNYQEAKRILPQWKTMHKGCYIGEYWGV